MKALLYYLAQVVITSGILYAYYHFALRNKKFNRYNRFYLLAATVISITIPFLNIPVYFTQTETESSFVLQTLTVISSTGSDGPVLAVANHSHHINWFTWQNLSYCFYILIAFIALLRIIISLIKIRRIAKNNPVEQLDNIHFVSTSEPGTPFSFFRWLFWNRKIELHSEKGEQIFRHELFHINQKHSWDIMYMELLTVIFWINPFFHLMKKEVKAIHEFLADQFAITENTKWQYAELLLMQALNTNQRLVNPFFHNQIKRRIAMITTSKKPSYQYLRKLMVLPVAAIVMVLFAFTYKSQHKKKQILTTGNGITVVIDPGHGMDAAGKQNGAKASDGSYEDDIVLTIAKKVRDLNTNDRVKIILTRGDKNFVALKKRIEFANSQQAGLFISLHTNMAPEKHTDKKGIDIYISGKNKKFYPENKILANILFNYFSQIHSVINTPKRQEGIYVIDNSNCPSALVECGYLSNPDDLTFMKDPAGQEKIANSILQSIEQYAMQKEGDDWEERKNSVADTVKPDIRFINNPENGDINIIADSVLFDGGLAVNAKIISKESSKPLIVLNGRVLEGVELKDMNDIIKPEMIQSVNVLKGRSAASKYGIKVKDGVIEIFTKLNIGDINKIEITLVDTLNPRSGDNKIFDKVEIEPSFPGGDIKWRQYLERNLDASVPTKKKAPDGAYTVLIQFIVDKEGNISDVRALTNHGYGMENEALRIIKSGPRWTPAIQNGHQVKAYRKQPITFVVGKGQKNFPAEDKIFDKVETPPSFPGGDSAWKRYLMKNANSLVPVDSGAPAGVYKIMVQFIVHEDGSLSDVKALTNHGYGMENEAMRVIKMGPKWVPAKQNGHIVRAYVQQPITFAITEDDGASDQNSLQTTTNTLSATPKITVAELKKASVYKLLQLPEGTEIVRFRFTIETKERDIVEKINYGNQFSTVIKYMLDNAIPGRLITVEDITVKKDSQYVKIPPRLYTVTE